MDSTLFYYLLVAGITSLFCVGLVLFLKAPFAKLALASVKQLDIILNKRISENEQDRLILKNLKYVLVYLLISILILVCLVVFCFLLFNFLVENSIIQAIDSSSVYFYLAMFLGSFSLLLFRKDKNEDYNYWSKLLHRMVLSNYSLGEFLFKREKRIKGENTNDSKPFFVVSGLARAGTTALTTLLFESNKFHATTYANMPFLLAPSFWKKFYRPKKVKIRERAHGDQVSFSENSVEALEEYFFKVFLRDKFIDKAVLNEHEVDEDTYQEYLTFQSFFKNQAESFYLTKNNNFLLRYKSMRKWNDQFYMIVMFRSPVDHVESLIRQDENFTNQQKDSSFTLEYMNWLGHHEFGLGLKPFYFNGQERLDKKKHNDSNFWLSTWINYYSYILSIEDSERTLIVNYEDFLNKPIEIIQNLESKFGFTLDLNPKKFTPKVNSSNTTNSFDPGLLLKANKVYEQLLEKKLT